jgi:putative hydrolase of HD superfamily
MKKILSKLPGHLRAKYLDIWNEYVDNSTDSAKFVHNMDKLEMAIQAKEYEFDGYSKESLQVFLKSANDYIEKSDPDLVYKILQKINDYSI